jgi:CO/xanthine dehydrogenase Mo-binding subunit
VTVVAVAMVVRVTFVRERVLDLIANDLGLDPVEIRLRKYPGRLMVHGSI